MLKLMSATISFGTILGLMAFQSTAQTHIQRQAQRGCLPVARVMGHSAPMFVCAEDLVSPTRTGQSLRMICFSSPNVVITTESQRVSQLCSQKLPSHRQTCNLQNSSACQITRSSRRETLVLIQPVGSVHRQLQPWLRWQPVTGATSYRVDWRWRGQVLWSTQTPSEFTQTQVLAPNRLGETYELQITALTGTTPIGTTIRAYNLLSPQELIEVQQLLREVQATAPASVLATREHQAIFLRYGLVGDAVAALQTFAQSGRNPIYRRILGDRFLELGQLATAQTYYESALSLATQNSEEAKRIRKNLQDIIAIQSRLPSNNQPPQ
jgi:hypothetical protein